MSAFRVGQRVRVVWAPSLPFLLGREATVLSALETVLGLYSNEVAARHHIRVDGYGETGPLGNRLMAKPCQLEPLYDGNELVSWESMRDLWVPSEVTA